MKIPPPTIVACDGQKGILLASIDVGQKQQEYNAVYSMSGRTLEPKLTLHPQTTVGVELLQLVKVLLKGIKTKEKIDQWMKQLILWEQTYGASLKKELILLNQLSTKGNGVYTI